MSDVLDKSGPLSLGFIGGGVSSSIGPSHFAACRLDKRWQLVAGAFSRKSDTNHSTGEAWHISPDRIYDTWESLIEVEAENLDAIVVLLPTPQHFQVILELIEKQIPIICEKPMVGLLGEAEAIGSALKRSPNFIAVTYNYSGYPMVRELRERIKKGELGEIQKLHFEMPQEGFLRVDPKSGEMMKPQDWRLEDVTIPTICHDLGSHLFHLAVFLTGKKVSRTAGKFSNHSSYSDLVDDVMMWVEYEDGMKGDFWMSKSALGNRNGLKLRVFGTLGSAEWKQSEPEDLNLSYADGNRLILDRASDTLLCNVPRYNRYKAGHPAGFIEAFANLYGDIADALVEYREHGNFNNPFVAQFADSVACLKLFNVLVEANKSEKWVDLKLGVT